MGKGRKNKKRQGAKRSKGHAGGASTALVYRGPIVPRNLATNTQMDTLRLSGVASVQSSVSGTMVFTLVLDPTVLDQWGTVKSLWMEVQCLAYRMQYVPRYPNWGNTTGLSEATGPVVWWMNRDSTISSPTTYGAAWKISGSKARSINQPCTMTWRMNGVNEAVWSNTSAGSIPFAAIGATATSLLSASTIYGEAFVEMLCHFRGLRY